MRLSLMLLILMNVIIMPVGWLAAQPPAAAPDQSAIVCLDWVPLADYQASASPPPTNTPRPTFTPTQTPLPTTASLVPIISPPSGGLAPIFQTATAIWTGVPTPTMETAQQFIQYVVIAPRGLTVRSSPTIRESNYIGGLNYQSLVDVWLADPVAADGYIWRQATDGNWFASGTVSDPFLFARIQ